MIRVLVVEDEPVAAEAHRAYVERTAGFTAVEAVASMTKPQRQRYWSSGRPAPP